MQPAHSGDVVSGIYVDDKVKDYIVDIVLATRDPKPYGIDLNGWYDYDDEGVKARPVTAVS